MSGTLRAQADSLCHKVGFDPESRAFKPEAELDSQALWKALQQLSQTAQQEPEHAVLRAQLKATMDSLCNKLMGKIAKSGVFMKLNEKADIPFRRETLTLADDGAGSVLSGRSDPTLVLRLSDPLGGLYHKGEVIGFRGDSQRLCSVIDGNGAHCVSRGIGALKQSEDALGEAEEIAGLFVSSGLFVAAASAVTTLGSSRVKASLAGVKIATSAVHHGATLQMDLGFQTEQGWFQKTFRGALDGRGLPLVCALDLARDKDVEPTSRMIAQAAKALHEARIDYMMAGKHTKQAWHPAMLFKLDDF